MTKLHDFIVENNLTYYKISKEMGKDCTGTSHLLKKKIKGEKKVSVEDAKEILFAIEEIIKRKIDKESFIGDVTHFYFK